MKWLNSIAVAYLGFFCRMFDVTPDGLRRGRRGNLPPEQGSPGSY